MNDTPSDVPDGNNGMELPDPETVADELAELSRRLDGELRSSEHAYLNAADDYLRRLSNDE